MVQLEDDKANADRATGEYVVVVDSLQAQLADLKAVNRDLCLEVRIFFVTSS